MKSCRPYWLPPLTSRGAGTESVAIDDGVRYSLFPSVAGTGRTTVVADASIVAEAIRFHVALLGLLSGRLLDGSHFSFLSVPAWRFLLSICIYTSSMRYVYRDFANSIRLTKMRTLTHIRYLWAGSRTIWSETTIRRERKQPLSPSSSGSAASGSYYSHDACGIWHVP